MRVGYFVASRGETPGAPLRPAQEKRRRVFAALVASLGLMVASSASRALELPKPEPVAKYLGKAATGTNYTVNPIVRSDGVMRIFDVDTPYGNFAFDGIEFAKLRIHELNAIAAIEKMSQSEEFGKAFGRAALGPIKFGADLITNPAGTVERSLTGIGNMFDRFGAGLSNNRADRDGLVDSLLGVSDTQRELAVDLDVDPYTDFPPLAQKLKEMAGVMASGGLPIKAVVICARRHWHCHIIGRNGQRCAGHVAQQNSGTGDCRDARHLARARHSGREHQSPGGKSQLHAGRPFDHGARAQKAQS